MNTFRDRLVLLFATGAGAGYVRPCPGTTGTLLAVPLSLAVNHIAAANFLLAFFIVLTAIVFAISISGQAARALRHRDPSPIVIDEIVGYVVANFLAPPRLAPLLLSFLIFRFFDIAKVFPANRLERLPGGAGIVLDDVTAGLYTLGSLRLLAEIGFV